jgi:hypothetical protein
MVGEVDEVVDAASVDSALDGGLGFAATACPGCVGAPHATKRRLTAAAAPSSEIGHRPARLEPLRCRER